MLQVWIQFQQWKVRYMRSGRFGDLDLLDRRFPPLLKPAALTADDYARAEKFLGYNANPLVLRAGVRPTWLPDDRFWYRIATENGNEFILVDPARGRAGAAFDQSKSPRRFRRPPATKYEPFRLPFTTFSFEDNGRSIAFNAGAQVLDLRRRGR